MSPYRLKMTKFRLKLDMSQFYDDERNLVYIMVDPKWDQVLCLQEHVEKLFGVTMVHFLTDDGVYIPPRESIEVIRNTDVLRAMIPHKIKKKKKKSKSRTYDGFGDELEAEIEDKGEKRKCNDDRLPSSTPNLRPRKKQRISKVDNSEENTLVNMLTPKSQQSSTNSDTVTSTINNSQVVDITEEEPMNEETTKSRKRKRNRKKNKQDIEDQEKSSRLSSVPVPISSSTLRLSKTMETPNRSPKHVHFDEDLTLVEPKKDRVVYQCRLNMDEILVPREMEEESILPPQKPTIVIHENIVLVKGNDDSLDPNDSSVIEIEDSIVRPEPEKTQDVTESTVIEDPTKAHASISIEEILPLAEPLLGLPNIGEIVIFKVYRLDKQFCPGVSDYICGRCEEVDSTKRTMNCLVLEGLDQIDDQSPRYTPVDADKTIENDTLNCVVLFLDELLDTRIFKMS